MMLNRSFQEAQQAKEKVMKAFAKSILFTGVLVMGANGLMAGQATDRWLDQWNRAKYGRQSPMEEARKRAEAANTAFREETAPESRQVATPTNTWLDQLYRAKFGRSSPATEARQRVEQENTAFREETPGGVTVRASTWREQFYKAKLGFSSSSEETRQRAESR
jgi:5'-3' exonuclease